MQASTQPPQRGFLYGLKTSIWVTHCWEWFLSLAARAIQPTLFVTVMYSIASTYPGVKLPPGVDLTMFIIQNAALDVASFGLPKLANQAEREGNQQGATEARKLARHLFWIMVSNLVWGGIEHVVPIDGNWKAGIALVFVIIRAFYAVRYSVVIHGLQANENAQPQTRASTQPPDDNHLVDTINEAIDQRTQSLCTQMTTLASQVETLCTQVSTQRSVQSEGVHNFVDMDQFKQLSHVVYTLSNTVQQIHVSVTEVHNNVLQISGHRGEDQRVHDEHTVTSDSLETLSTETLSTESLPVLSVPGISQDKVNQILTLFLQGIKWRDIPGNYSRTIKPIREAYESYVHTTTSAL